MLARLSGDEIEAAFFEDFPDARSLRDPTFPLIEGFQFRQLNNAPQVFKGGMGIVFRCVGIDDEREYAIKLTSSERDLEIYRKLTEIRSQGNQLRINELIQGKAVALKEGAAPLYCMVFPWHKGDLKSFLNELNARYPEPSNFSGKAALVFAHVLLPILRTLEKIQATVSHRDLKPENILLDWSSEGVEPFLTDFGIGKDHSSISDTNTLAPYRSELYFSSRFTAGTARDVFAFAVTTAQAFLWCTNQEASNRDDLISKFDGLGFLPSDLKQILLPVLLERDSADVDMTSLLRNFSRISYAWSENRRGHVVIRPVSKKELTRWVSSPGITVSAAELKSEFECIVAIRLDVMKSELSIYTPRFHFVCVENAERDLDDGRNYFGEEYEDEDLENELVGPWRLFIKKIYIRSEQMLPRIARADERLVSNFSFCFGDGLNDKDKWASQQQMKHLFSEAEDWEESLRSSGGLLEDLRLLVEARKKKLRDTAPTTAGILAEQDGSLLTFNVKEKSEDNSQEGYFPLGAFVSVLTDDGKTVSKGEIVNAGIGFVEVDSSWNTSLRLAGHFTLAIDERGTTSVLDRQMKALKSIQNQSLSATGAGSLIDVLVKSQAFKLGSSVAFEPFRLSGEGPYRSDETDETQALNDVVEKCLASRVATVQGPPGTGKTTLIIKLITEYSRLNPSGRVLVVSQSRDAVDELIERALKEELAWANALVRVGRESSIREGARQVGIASHTARFRSEISNRIDSLSDVGPEYRLRQILTKYLGDLSGGDRILEGLLIRNARIVAGTCLAVASAGRKWQTKADGFSSSADLEGGMQDFDLCIIDEASKAHALESIVPMARAQRWILVGDTNQLGPFAPQGKNGANAEFDEHEVRTLEKSLLSVDSLVELQGLSILSHLKKAKAMSAELTIQKRMLPPIGDVVSEAFYESTLRNGLVDEPNSFTGLEYPLRAAVSWIDTSGLNSVQSRNARGSLSNKKEIKVVDWLVKQLHDSVSDRAQISVGLISFYGRQVVELERLKRKLDLKFSDDDRLVLNVRTVDKAQGAQFDVVILSFVVANEKGRIGFLSRPERVNVAISRARYRLFCVGDYNTISASTAGSMSVKRVAEIIRRQSSREYPSNPYAWIDASMAQTE